MTAGLGLLLRLDPLYLVLLLAPNFMNDFNLARVNLFFKIFFHKFDEFLLQIFSLILL